MPTDNFIQGVADALAGHPLIASVITEEITLSGSARAFALMKVTGSARRKATFILLEPGAATPEEAAGQAACIASLTSTSEGSDRPMLIVRDLWERQREMMLSRMLAHCGIFQSIFARNCEVRRIDKATANAFMSTAHSYGGASCRHCYGLFSKKDGRLVAAAEFSNARKWIKEGREIRSHEWVRYASLPGTRVIGGMGKTLKKFISDIHPDDIMTYADLEWSDGEGYRRLGFTQESRRSPVLFLIDTGSWERKAAGLTETAVTTCKCVYYQNDGSLKFRLRPSFPASKG